jgi:phosphoadenosine phosphosulfate reductase
MEPLAAPWPASSAWMTGLRREQSGARAEVPLIDTTEQTTKGLLKLNPLADWTWGDVWHYIAHEPGAPTTRCTTSFSPASAARPAPAPSAWARTSAPGAGGGKTKPPRNADCT